MEGGSGSERRRLLVLGAGAGQLGLLEAARSLGHFVVAVDRNPAAPGFVHADRRAIVSVEDEHAIDRLAAAEQVDGIIAPGIDFPVAIAARVAARHNLPHPLSPDAAQAAVSKLKQRERLTEAGVPHAAFRICASVAKAREAADELGYPCVIKPPDRQGQRGLSIVTGPDDLTEAFDAALSAARGPTVLVEKLIDGRELTVNAFSVGGAFHALTVTDRIVAEPPAFGVALAHVWPSELPSDVVEEAVALARAAADAIGVEDGPTYTQVLVGEDGAFVGELAARVGGGHDAELCEAALGVDLNGLAIAVALGEEIPSDKLSLGSGEGGETAGGACVRFLVAPEGSWTRSRASSAPRTATASCGCGCIDSRATTFDRCAMAPIAPGPSWPWAKAASRRWPGVSGRRDAYAFALLRPAPPSRSRRATFLGFQPPALGEEEIAAVAETLRSGWLTTGPKTAELEQRFAEYVGAERAVAVASGTAAMHLSLLALGVGPGDEVITTPITWPATANVILHSGATPVFADVRDSDLNIDPERARELVGPRTKAILPVHLAGQSVDLDPLWALGLPVVEDAAHAVESAYRGRKIGGLSDATCFSLYATKNVAAGEGGVVTTNRADVAGAIDDLRLMRRGHGSRYDIAVPGYKANLSDVLASIALTQLDKLARHREIRLRYVDAYDAAVADLDGIEPLVRDPRDTHALHLYVVRIDAEQAGATRDEYQQAMTDERIGTSIHFLPVHRLSAYRERFPDQPPLPVAERAGNEVLSLPLSPAHSDDDIADAIDALRRVHARFTGGRT